MDYILKSQFSWGDFILITILLVLLYWLLLFLEKALERFTFFGKYQMEVKNFIHHFLLIYEALVYLILGSVFVLINPSFHGIWMTIIVIAGFSHIKNYFSGRILQFQNAVSVGQHLKTEGKQGIVSEMGRLGVKLKTSKGLQFINYSKLVNDGYMLLSGEEVGGFYQLQIQPKEPDEKMDYPTHLMDLLVTSPYLDWNHKPQLMNAKDASKTIKARVVVKEESHLFDLVKVIQERGFQCKVV